MSSGHDLTCLLDFNHIKQWFPKLFDRGSKLKTEGYLHSERGDDINIDRIMTEPEANGANSIGESKGIAKRGFGSFMSSNIDDLIEYAGSCDYIPPALPVKPPGFEEYAEKEFEFGHAAKRKHFYLEDECIFLNHGAFGGVLKEALEYSQEWQRYIEREPVRFYDRVFFPQLIHAQKRLAEFVGCDVSDLVLISNATSATNSVLQSLNLTPDSTIYYLNTTYGAVKKNIKYLSEKTGAKRQEEKINFPIKNEDEILNLVDRTLKEKTTIAVLDHIPSNYGFIMPVKKLVDLCHKRGVPVLIDGAHALGALSLNLTDLGADYYISNAHKWLCAPKGCAFLYVKKELQPTVKSLVVSHGFESGFQSQFLWTGLKDNTAFLSLHAVLNFWKQVGVENIRSHGRELLKKAVELLQRKWKSELIAPLVMNGFLCCVSLPSSSYSEKPDASFEDGEAIQDKLYHDYNIEVPIKCIQNKLYVRISCHLHNEIKDYEKLADAVLEISKSL
ncbi:uncharacterized protein LOC120330848 isoform X1 [Styela clava]